MIEDYTLFDAKVADMLMDYPELKGYKEFEELTTRELKLCWYVGNRTSPIAKYNKKARYQKAIKMAYTETAQKGEEVKKMMEGDLPDHILLGIQRMATFNPSVRLRAKFSTEYIFDKLEKIIEVDDNELKAMDFDDKKKYTDLVIKISADMPEMVKRMEGAYGLRVDTSGRKRRKKEVKASIQEL
jgi:hypothetical protein